MERLTVVTTDKYSDFREEGASRERVQLYGARHSLLEVPPKWHEVLAADPRNTAEYFLSMGVSA